MLCSHFNSHAIYFSFHFCFVAILNASNIFEDLTFFAHFIRAKIISELHECTEKIRIEMESRIGFHLSSVKWKFVLIFRFSFLFGNYDTIAFQIDFHDNCMEIQVQMDKTSVNWIIIENGLWMVHSFFCLATHNFKCRRRKTIDEADKKEVFTKILARQKTWRLAHRNRKKLKWRHGTCCDTLSTEFRHVANWIKGEEHKKSVY